MAQFKHRYLTEVFTAEGKKITEKHTVAKDSMTAHNKALRWFKNSLTEPYKSNLKKYTIKTNLIPEEDEKVRRVCK